MKVEENQKHLGIPRSQSESGLFAKIRNFCFSKSPTQESVPPPLDMNNLNIPNLTSTKSSSDLNLLAQKTSEKISDESAIDFMGKKVVEKFEFEFKAKKTDCDNAIEEVIKREAGPLDENSLKDTKVAWPEQNISDTNISNLTKGVLHTEGDKCTAIEDKGARPKTASITNDLNQLKGNGSVIDYTPISLGYLSENSGNISNIGCELNSLVNEKTVEETNDLENQKPNGNKTQLSEFSDQNIFNKNNSVATNLKSENCEIKERVVPDKLLGFMVETEKSTSETTEFPQVSNAMTVMSVTSEDVTSIDVLNNNLRVTSAGEIMAVTPDSWEDKMSDILMASSNGNASDDEWSDFVVYNPDKNCDRSK